MDCTPYLISSHSSYSRTSNRYAVFQVVYFLQPDTTPLKLGRDIAAKLSKEYSDSLPSNEESQNSEIQENGPAPSQALTEKSETQIEVVPLYTPAGSAIKFFCVHPTHCYAMSLAAISTGFKGQVNA